MRIDTERYPQRGVDGAIVRASVLPPFEFPLPPVIYMHNIYVKLYISRGLSN
jgi:hypothetical protein